MKNYRIARVMVLVVLGCVGCAGDKSPREKCEDLINVSCDRLVECIAGASGMHAACVQAVEQAGLSCTATKSVTPSYDRCIDQLNEQSCRVLFPTDSETGDQALELPAECNGVLVTRSAPGEHDHVMRTNALPSDRSAKWPFALVPCSRWSSTERSLAGRLAFRTDTTVLHTA